MKVIDISMMTKKQNDDESDDKRNDNMNQLLQWMIVILFVMKIIAMTNAIVKISLFVHPVIQDVMMNNMIVASDMITDKEI